MKSQEAVETWLSGNITDFREWVKRTSKLNLLKAIEYYSANYGKRHQIISYLKSILEE